MICDTSDIGRTDFEDEDISEIFGRHTHAMGLILRPESRRENALVDRIEESFSRHAREYTTIIKKMKSMVIRKSQTTKTYITSPEILYFRTE